MSYANIVAQLAIPELRQQVVVALVKQAALRASSSTPAERMIIQQIINSTVPDSWVMMVLLELDVTGQLPASPNTPTDEAIDAVIATGVPGSVPSVWAFMTAARGGA
jgi:hypothetical protein